MTERASNRGPAVATKPPATLAPRTLEALAMRYRWMPLAFRVTPEQEAIGLDLSQRGEFIELEPMRQFGLTE